jgi:adenosylhomocysteine nucleosidase
MDKIVILVCSDFEWRVVRKRFKDEELNQSPYGNWFVHPDNHSAKKEVIWFKSGWGKIGSAGSTQYVIDKWKPELIINIGTCGGFRGKIDLYQIVLIKKTVVYDMIDFIGTVGKSIKYHKTNINLSYLKDKNILVLPKVVMVTGDQDLSPVMIPELHETYKAVVGDWESGSISWICKKNGTKLLIIRGVSDLVGLEENPAYNEDEVGFREGVKIVMPKLIDLVNDFVSKETDGVK